MNFLSLPSSLEVGGREYKISADFRDILEIIAYLGDPDESDRAKTQIALALFYEDFDAMPRSDWGEALKVLFDFISCGEADDTAGPKRIDWEQDQRMIIADVNKVAGREIRALPFVHWWTFTAWFLSVGDGQLAQVVAIREKRRKGEKLEKWERDFYRENKAKVDFKRRLSQEEIEEEARIKALLDG